MLNPITPIPVNTQNNIQSNSAEAGHALRSSKIDHNEESFDNVLEREMSEEVGKSEAQPGENTINHKIDTEDSVEPSNSQPNIKGHVEANQLSSVQNPAINTDLSISSVAISTIQLFNNPIANASVEIGQYSLQQASPLNNVIQGVDTRNSVVDESFETLNASDSPEMAFTAIRPTVSLLSNQDRFTQSNALVNMSRQYVAGQAVAGTANFAAQGRILPQLMEIGITPSDQTNELSFMPLSDLVETKLTPLSDLVPQTGLTHFSAPSSVNSSTATHPIADLQVYTQVGQPKWDGDFAQKIVLMANQQNQVAEIRLNPAHLGPVEVTLNMINDQGTQAATAHFMSAHLAVREAIEASLPKLREMLAESGIALGNVTVGSESSDRQANSGQQHQGSGKFSNATFNSNVESGEYSKASVVIAPHRHQGLVNTFA